MPSSRAERIALGLTLGVIVLLGAVIAFAALRFRVVSETSRPDSQAAVRRQQLAQGNTPAWRRERPAPTRRSPSPPPSESSPIAVDEPAAPSAGPERAAIPQPVPAVRVLAARGDSWAEVRKGSESGKVLYAGIIVQGDSRTFRNRRLWIRFGAPENVDASIGGEPAPLPSGTLNMLVTPRGFIAAA